MFFMPSVSISENPVHILIDPACVTEVILGGWATGYGYVRNVSTENYVCHVRVRKL